jgi:hypothetical protein
MSDLDREQFIGRWHEAVAAKLGSNADPNRVRSIGESLSGKLRENPPIRRLASNPLLCGAICALHYFRNEFLPGSQRELCETLCHLLIHRREVEGGLRLDEYPEAYRTLTYDHKKSIIQDFAHYMVLEEESALNTDRAYELTAKALRTFPGRKEEDAKEVCNGLIERSGVLRQASTNTIDFIHNTLKEFMAAEHFVADRNAGLLAKRAVDPSWKPVVLFCRGVRGSGPHQRACHEDSRRAP